MILVKSYNTIGNLLAVNTYLENDVGKRSIYLIPLNLASKNFNLCLNCDEDTFTESDDENELKPLFDGFDYMEIDFVQLFALLNDGSLEDYKFDKEELDNLYYEQFLEEFQEEE